MNFIDSNDIYNEVEKLIKNAQHSIRISSAWIKSSLIEKLLNATEEDNIDLEVVIRASELRDLLITDSGVLKKIKKFGGKIYLNNRLHAKFIIVDDEKAVVGSANFTEAGFSEYKDGNIEAAVYYDEKDEIGKLKNYFDQIKKDSRQLDNIIGFALNPVKSRSFEFILIDEDVIEQSYVEVKTDDGIMLAKITSIYAYDMGFFANPFSTSESNVFAPVDILKKIFDKDKDKDWQKAAVLAYINESAERRIKVAKATIVGVLKNSKLDTSLRPFEVGETVSKASKSTLNQLLTKNFSHQNMQYPIKIGVMSLSNTDVFIDAKEIITKHMLILGTTGSGKSYFTKLFLSRLLDDCKKDIQIIILDPHGEYYDELLNFGVPNGCIDHVQLNDTIFPIYPEEVEQLIKDAGYSELVSGSSKQAQRIKGIISKYIKPFLGNSYFLNNRLLDLFKEISQILVKNYSNGNARNAPAILDAIKEITLFRINVVKIWDKAVLNNQNTIYNNLNTAIRNNQKVIIFNFSKITDPKTRVNLAGLIMDELFKQNKQSKKERLVVLEEAHNFAPESSYGDVSSGRDNLALTMTRKIASEGRKFNLGLVVITQRPAQVSKYVLSQANTQAMFRTMNSADLAAIENYVEFAGRDMIELLPSLQTGMGILSGLGVPFPMVVEII